MSRCKECIFELNGVIRETSRRAYQDNSQAREDISRCLGTLERKTMQEETQCRFIEHSMTLFQEGIKSVREHSITTHYEVLESLRESQDY
jgi:hypothetical protein